MQCPKCKKPIPDNTLRCPSCNLLVKIVCKKCGTVNLMGNIKCKSCGSELLKVCPNCKTINSLSAKKCRKCNTSLEKKSLIAQMEESQKNVDLQQNVVKPDEQPNNNTVTTQTQPTKEEKANEQKTEQKETAEIQTVPEQQAQKENPALVDNQPEGVITSSDDVTLSDVQLENIINQVEEIDKNTEKRQEAEVIIQKKFEQQVDIDEQLSEEIPPEYVQLDQAEAQKAIIEAIQNPLKRIISLNGREGLGKSLIIKYVFDALKQESYVWAFGECNALTQITPFGFIQDVLLNLFNISNYSVNIDEFTKNNEKALQAQFFNLSHQEILDLINFLYPYKKSEFNGILKRKEYTINLLKKVFEIMTLNSTVVFIADDFENIDGASFDFLKNVLEDDKLNEKIKILITNKHNKIAQGYFYNKNLKSNNYSNIFLSPLDKEQVGTLINTLFGSTVNLPPQIMGQICKNSKGTSAYVEQACLYMFEKRMLINQNETQFEFDSKFDNYELPINTYKIIEERLQSIESEQPLILKALYFASILGNKFSVAQFENVMQLSKEDFTAVCNALINANYLCLLSDNYLTFKNTLVWHYVYERAKTCEDFREYNKTIHNFIKDLTLSNNSLKPLLLQNFDNKKEAFENWKRNTETSSYLGDTNLYVISLKQQLKLAGDVPETLSSHDKVKIFKQMGKILYKISPKEAINYISAAIAYYKETETYNAVEIIELAAYLTQSCHKVADYIGIIETCDTVLEVIPPDKYTVERALIASKKLSALLYLGNCEEVINIANTDILNIIENALAQPNSSNIVPDKVIFDIWIDTSLNLATAYAIQGDKKVFNVLSKVDDALVSNNIHNETYNRKVLITKALAYSLRGEAKLSNEVLNSITSQYSSETMEEEFILRWNFINIINKIISKDYQNLVDEMFQVTTFADNIDDLFTKNMLKLLLGYIIKTKSKNAKKALDIFNEEIVFFAKEKVAIGALLSWLFIAKASLSTKGVDFALDIALKALDVAKSPKIDNHIFIIALKYIIADFYIIKNDFEAVKMYLEKAMTIAKKYDLRYLQMLLYTSFAKYNEELINIYKDNMQEYANRAIEMYSVALKISQQLSLGAYENSIKKDVTSFKVACQLKNLQIVTEEE